MLFNRNRERANELYHRTWIADGATVKAVSHGQWFKVTRADGLRHTAEGNAANARLIAAAPDLLDALEAAVAANPQSYIHQGTGRHDPEPAPRPQWVLDALAAIAKATSSQP